MSNITKVVSSSTIIAAILRTFKPTGSSWINETVEDIGWAIQGIGYHTGFEKKQTKPPYITVANNRAKIPCDVERILAVEMLLPKSTNGNTLNPDGTTPAPSTEQDDCNFRGIRLRLGTDLTGYGLGEDNPRTTMMSPAVDYYNLNTDYIITSFASGLIKLHYVAFKLDKNSLPMIIDDFDYKTAIQWYCFSNMILKGYKHPEVSYRDALSLWEQHRLRAENAVKVPSLDSAERFRAGWNRYAGGTEFGKDFYMNLEQPEY